MVTATVLVIIFAPLFFVLIETFLGKGRKGDAVASVGARPILFGAERKDPRKRSSREVTGLKM